MNPRGIFAFLVLSSYRGKGEGHLLGRRGQGEETGWPSTQKSEGRALSGPTMAKIRIARK